MLGETVTVRSLKYGGIPHYTYPLRLRSRSADLWVLEGEFGRVLHHHTRGLTIPVQNRSVEYFWPGRPYSVAADMAPDGSVTKYYCNVILPPVMKEDQLSVVDLDLDLLVKADLSYVVLDRDEFEANRVRYGYPPEVAAGAETALQELIGLVERRAYPFGGSGA